MNRSPCSRPVGCPHCLVEQEEDDWGDSTHHECCNVTQATLAGESRHPNLMYEPTDAMGASIGIPRDQVGQTRSSNGYCSGLLPSLTWLILLLSFVLLHCFCCE